MYAHGFRTTILKGKPKRFWYFFLFLVPYPSHSNLLSFNDTYLGCKNGGAYYQHPLFVRDKPELANNIQKIVKGRPSKASQCRDLTSSADVQTIISFSEGNLSLSGEKENLSTSTKMGSKRTYTSFVNPTEQMFAYEKLTFTNTTLALPPPLNPTAATTRPQSPSLSQPVPQQQLQQLQDSHSFSALLSFLDQQADHCLATNQIDLEPRPLPPNFNASRCQNGQSTATAEQSFADDIFSGMSFYAI